jgi:hypothetical protein
MVIRRGRDSQDVSSPRCLCGSPYQVLDGVGPVRSEISLMAVLTFLWKYRESATYDEDRCAVSDTVEFGGWPRPPRWVWAIAGVAAVAVLAGVVVARTGPHRAGQTSAVTGPAASGNSGLQMPPRKPARMARPGRGTVRWVMAVA